MRDFSSPGRALKPQHLWLLLALQSERYESRRQPRYYWAELAGWAGVSVSTVRRWAYELKDLGLLKIIPCREQSASERKRVGVKNDRNRFDLSPLDEAMETRQRL